MKKLTDEQKMAISSTDESAAVVAGAGSGKTTVLIERCLNIIGDNPSSIDKILAITFTEKAAAELKARLRVKLPPREHHRLTGAWIGTFHGCCARMLRQHAPLMLLDPSFQIIDENASNLLIRQSIKSTLLDALQKRDPQSVLLVDALDFKNASNALEDLMGFRWHARRVLSSTCSDNAQEAEMIQAMASVYGMCERAYLDALASQDALDFQELEISALNLLDRNPDILESYRTRFRHMLVDEFQDTNDLQTELVLKLYSPDKNHLCIVGDPRQSIYRFRGANVDCFETALKAIRRSDGKVIPLMHNFRSRKGIVDFVNIASDHMSAGLFGTHPDDEVLTVNAEKLIAARTDETNAPSVLSLDIEDGGSARARRRNEANAIALYIKDLIKHKNHALGDIVCLFQALTNVDEYESAFKAHDIPYRFYGGRGLLDRQEVCDLMHALSYAENPDNDMALLGLLRSPLIGLSDDECVRLAGAEGKDLKSTAREHPSCTLLNTLEKEAFYRLPSELLRLTINETGYDWILSQLDPSGGMQASIDRLVCLAQSLERQAPTTLSDFISFISHLRERNARLGDPPAAGESRGAVQCMTVHTAKGLEFPVVILPDLIRQERNQTGVWIFHREKGIAFKLKDPLHPFGQRIPTDLYEDLSNTEKYQSEAEHARLLYVAMTRARDMLVLPIHRSDKIKGRWHGWLKGLPSGQKIELSNNTMTESSADRPVEKPTYRKVGSFNDCEVGRTFSVSKLEAYERCPQEFYLKYVLNIPAANFFQRSEEKLPRNVRGSIVHKVLERLTPANLDSLEEMIAQECISNDIYPNETTIRDILQPILTFIETPLFKKAALGRREVRFDWPCEGNIITGFIDWFLDGENGLEIVDFKTDNVDHAGVSLRAQEYDLQMTAYALALEASLGQKVAATTLVFLTPNEVKTSVFDRTRRSEGLERIRKVMSSIKKEDFDITSIKPPCDKCPYHHNSLCWKDRSVDHG